MIFRTMIFQCSWFLTQCCLRDWRSQAFNYVFHCYLFRSFDIPGFLVTVHTEMFLNWWTICPRCFSQSGEKQRELAPSLRMNNWAIRGCLFYSQSWHCYLLPINLFTPEMFQIFKVLLLSNSEWMHIYKNKKVISLNIKDFISVLCSI